MRFLNVVIKTFSLDKITFKMTQTTMLSTNLSYSRNVTSLLSTAYLSNVIKANFKMCIREVFEHLLNESILKYFCNYIFYKVINKCDFPNDSMVNMYLSYVFICNISRY